MSVTLVEGGIAINVVPTGPGRVNYRYAPGRTPADAEARLVEVCGPFGELTIDSNAPSGAVPSAGNAVLGRLREHDLGWEPKQAWTPVAEFAAVGVDAVNFGPGDPRFAHRRDEQVAVDALARSYDVLERVLCP
jgi:succinyl-diaminopimelate desuccinylase